MTSYEGAASPARGGTEPGPAIDRGRTLPAGDGRRLRVLLLDGQDLVHWGFKTLLAAEHWVERFVAAHSADEAIELARRHAPHVAVVDLAAATGSVGELYARLRSASPGTRMLLMSSGDRISTRAARAAGASGFVSKRRGAREIAGAARMVGLGMTLFEPDNGAARSILTQREREVLELVAAGSTNREIARRLFLSHHTVKDHTSALYRKMGARNRAEAILRAQRLGLLDNL
ncbi:MAG: response regulator transcription factor [Actinobacteria bacterium]|nr:MAG: response regulator transcription factor [Actinomycetota bacterium]